MPEVRSDDKFVRLLFRPDERVYIADEHYEVLAPQTFRELVRQRAGYAAANRELRAYYRGRAPEDAPRHSGASRFIFRPVDALVLILVSLAATLRSFG